VGILSASIVAIAVHRSMLYDGLSNPFAALLLYPRTDVRADALLVGALLAHLWVHGWTPRRGLGPAAWIALVALAVCISRTWELDPFLFHGGFTLVALAGGVIVLATVERGWAGARVLRWRVLGVLGLVSYGLYLWHAPVFLAVERFGARWPPALRVVVALTITGAAVTLSWFLVEQPARRGMARLDPGRSSPR
jgi:peptidoglycan/LPS O-acetylase OafA/YrhL